MRAQRSHHGSLERREGDQLLLTDIVEPGGRETGIAHGFVPRSEKAHHVDARIGQVHEHTQRGTRAKLRAVLQPGAIHHRRPGSSEALLRGKGFAAEAIPRELRACPGDDAAGRIVREQREQEQILSPVADRFIAISSRPWIAGVRGDRPDRDPAAASLHEHATAARRVQPQLTGFVRHEAPPEPRRADLDGSAGVPTGGDGLAFRRADIHISCEQPVIVAGSLRESVAARVQEALELLAAARVHRGREVANGIRDHRIGQCRDDVGRH